MKTGSSVTHGSAYVQHFFQSVCCEASATARILSQLYPDGPKCASCGMPITGRRALETFWRGARTYCACCGCKFNPNSNTILENAHLSYAQFEIICVLLSLGVNHKCIAAITNTSTDTVAIWHSKINFWESHV